tara:strand:- start:83 stop:925 length:843 start_codon:yes stop_codon:yes gene_type:complete
MNALQLLNLGSHKLKKRSILSHKLDSELLLSKILKKSREKVIIDLDQKISLINISRFNDYINRRSSSEPIAYILKEKEFWSKSFDIEKNTLIPRPETELMVEKLVKIFKNKRLNVVDIGTGSGCILISLLSEIKNSKGLGIDVSQQSILIAKKNAKKHKVETKIKFSRKTLTMLCHNKFDLVVSNPPYIKTKDLKNLQDDIKYFEPKLALDGGIDGLDVIKKVIYKTKEILKKNGVLALEIGNNQYKKVSEILINNNFRLEHKIKDYKENVRCLISRYTN